jgi:hypothetical protein
MTYLLTYDIPSVMVFQYVIAHALFLHTETQAHTGLTERFITHSLFLTHVLGLRAEDSRECRLLKYYVYLSGL